MDHELRLQQKRQRRSLNDVMKSYYKMWLDRFEGDNSRFCEARHVFGRRSFGAISARSRTHHLHAGRSFAYVPASARLGAVRYRCPESGSYVLITDPAALKRLSTGPVHCAGCGAAHCLLCSAEPLVGTAA